MTFPASLTHQGVPWSCLVDIVMPNRPDVELIRRMHRFEVYVLGHVLPVEVDRVPEAVKVGLAADAVATFLDSRAADLLRELGAA